MTTRRRLLLAAGGVLSLSGCTFGSGPQTRVAEIRLENQSDTARRFAVEIEISGETLYEGARTVAPVGDEPTPALTNLPTERGRVTVSTEVLGTDAAASVTYESDRCRRLIAEYERGDVQHYSTIGGGACETTAES